MASSSSSSTQGEIPCTLEHSCPINIPCSSSTHDPCASPRLPNTPPPTPETSQPPPPREHPDPPKYLTAEFIEAALRTKKPGIKVTDLKLTPAVGIGENYVCIVFRAKVQTSQGPMDLIAKCLPETAVRAKMATDNEFTIKEMKIYNEILPLLTKDLPKDDPNIPTTPYCYYTVRDASADVLILEDMRPHGYRVMNRFLGLDKAQGALTLQEIAKFHALSIHMRITDPETFKQRVVVEYAETMYSERNRDLFTIFLNSAMDQTAAGMRESFPLRYHGLADVVHGLREPIFDWICELLAIPPDKTEDRVLCLNHGDCWVNNMLFKFDSEEKPVSCCLLDFQIARCASPSLDLHYFLFTSLQRSVRQEHMRDLLQIYLEQVYTTLAALGHERPLPPNMFYENVDQIYEDMKENALFGFLTAALLLPVIVAKSEDAPDMENLDESKIEENMGDFTKLYTGELFKERFVSILDDFDDMGFFARYKVLIDQYKEQHGTADKEKEEDKDNPKVI